MLQKLTISNYAIIEEVSISFSYGLNIITGETGAGKSILMGALSLILGERAESGVLLNKEKKCVVEGNFDIKENDRVKDFLKANELDGEKELIVRREIAVNGKSRAFINDTPVNLVQLKEASSMLVDLHQQFDTLELGDNNLQRELLDALAGNVDAVPEYIQQFKYYKRCQRELDELKQQQKEQYAAFDYNKFLFDELEEISLKENELEHLDAELKLLSHAEEVKQELNAVYYVLSESEKPLVQELKSLSAKLESLKQYHADAEELGSRMQSLQVELADIADTIDKMYAGINYDAQRMELINDRLAVGYKLLKKHNVVSTNNLLAIKDSLQQKLDAVLNMDEAVAAKEKEVAVVSNSCVAMAGDISTKRQKAVKPFIEKVNSLLQQVGMPNAQIKIAVSPAALGEYGADSIDYLFDANKTGRFEPLHKVASGGELSRLMLCIKSVVAKKLKLPTLIFDEIDTGISGEAAKQVGIIMKGMSTGHQLISITHQPQIAARADAHYFVYKSKMNEKINTAVRLLTNAERVEAIARMIGGEKPSAAAMQNAKEMVE
ncbi:MAG: DNA repair protein RecN [Bacteroidota bacterium]